MKILLVGWFNLNKLCTKFNCNINDFIILADNTKARYYEKNNIQNYYCININDINDYIKVFNQMKNVDFDLIIANPPYGKIGVNITELIKDKINYKKFINLLPMNDYIRFSKDLFNYVNIKSIKAFRGKFKDAGVTTYCCNISKSKVNSLSKEEFEVKTYIDPSLEKYFLNQLNKNHYAIDNDFGLEKRNNPDLEKIIFIGCRDICHGGMPKNKYAMANSINLNLITYTDFCDKFCTKSAKKAGILYFEGNAIEFNTKLEKTNFSNFMYSDLGFKFYSKLFTAMCKDGRTKIHKVLPKVDWTKEWTVEEILREYDYTEEEIKEVMTDLVNYRGMDN